MILKEVEIEEKGLLIRINQIYRDTIGDLSLYEATRGGWVIGEKRKRVEYAFAVYKGQIKEVYKIICWYKAGTLEYKTRPIKDVNISGRWEFEGAKADQSVREKYLNKSVAHYLNKVHLIQ